MRAATSSNGPRCAPHEDRAAAEGEGRREDGDRFVGHIDPLRCRDVRAPEQQARGRRFPGVFETGPGHARRLLGRKAPVCSTPRGAACLRDERCGAPRPATEEEQGVRRKAVEYPDETRCCGGDEARSSTSARASTCPRAFDRPRRAVLAARKRVPGRGHRALSFSRCLPRRSHRP